MLVFMIIGLFGWDLIDDMEDLQLEAKVIEGSNRQNHDLHDLELDLHRSMDPVKEFLITGDYRLEAYFSRLHSDLFRAVEKYEQNYPNYRLMGVPEALEKIGSLSHEIFKLPYAVGNMEGPVILQEVTEKTRISVQQLSKQHHVLDMQVNEATRMMAGLRIDMHDEALALLLVLLVTLLCLTYFIYSQIVLPLVRMRKSVQQVADGDFDVQCQVKSQDEIGVLGSTFNAMGYALKERDKKLTHTRSLAAYHDKMSALGLMAGGIAHEVGNPLAAISVSLQVAQKKLTNDDHDAVQTQLQIALKEVARMEDIIQIILNFGRHESTATMRSFYVLPVIKEAIQLAQMSPRKKIVSIITNIPPRFPRIYAAEGMLLQVLLNLILNALDACSDKGSISIDVSEEDNMKTIIDIKDDGHGVASGIRGDIFNPDFTSKARGEGTGLGLAISRELVHSMNGSLVLVRSDAAGSCFRICLPMKEIL